MGLQMLMQLFLLFFLLGDRIRGTLGDKDPLNMVPF